MKIANGWMIAAALLGAPDIAASQPYSSAACVSRLQSAGLTPVVPFDPSRQGAAYHQLCVTNGPFYPVSVLVCRNSRTGALAPASQPQVLKVCQALAQQDPSWSLTTGYSCCGGTNASLGARRRR